MASQHSNSVYAWHVCIRLWVRCTMQQCVSKHCSRSSGLQSVLLDTSLAGAVLKLLDRVCGCVLHAFSACAGVARQTQVLLHTADQLFSKLVAKM